MNLLKSDIKWDWLSLHFRQNIAQIDLDTVPSWYGYSSKLIWVQAQIHSRTCTNRFQDWHKTISAPHTNRSQDRHKSISAPTHINLRNGTNWSQDQHKSISGLVQVNLRTGTNQSHTDGNGFGFTPCLLHFVYPPRIAFSPYCTRFSPSSFFTTYRLLNTKSVFGDKSAHATIDSRQGTTKHRNRTGNDYDRGLPQYCTEGGRSTSPTLYRRLEIREKNQE